MGSKESKHVILQFIKNCDGKATKNDVVKYMESGKVREMDRTSRITTLNLIDALEFPDHQVIIEKGKRRGQSHRLIFNDKNEFNAALTHIEGLESMSDNIAKILNTISLEELSKDNGCRNLIYFEQLKFYICFSITASRINDSIKSTDDRETLNLKLVKVLVSANKINKAYVMPLVISGINESIDELKGSNVNIAKQFEDYEWLQFFQKNQVAY